METKKELLQTQINLNGEAKKENTEIVLREDLVGTPFILMYIQDYGWTLTLGKNRLTEWMSTKDQVIEALEDRKWEIIGTMIMIVTEDKINSKNN